MDAKIGHSWRRGLGEESGWGGSRSLQVKEEWPRDSDTEVEGVVQRAQARGPVGGNVP